MRGNEPACWSWEIPPLRSREQEIELRLAAGANKPPGERYDRADLEWILGDDADNNALRFGQFHAGRCALCGGTPSHLVHDHCHRTGQVRGLLCRSCNTLEGRTSSELLVGYRRRHPAVILAYYEPYTGRDWLDGWYLGGGPIEGCGGARAETCYPLGFADHQRIALLAHPLPRVLFLSWSRFAGMPFPGGRLAVVGAR